jgi:diguanylate cyclase
LQFLRDEHCDEVQGYLLGRPAAIGQFRHLTHFDTALDTNAADTPAPLAKSA